ncbi:MAG: lipid biosynthesis B12-binding/radical SAM protein [Bacteroidota bacterium]
MAKRKVLFISANLHIKPYPVYPLGISYLMTYLDKNLPRTDFRVFDFNIGNLQSLSETLKEYNPDFIAVSLRNIDDIDSQSKISFIGGYESIMVAIRANSQKTVIMGGSGFSIYPELLFKQLKPDFAVSGEGEESLVQLILSLENGTSYRDIEGLVYSDNDTIIINKRKEYLKDLDLHLSDDLISYYWDHSGMLNIQTKRGCPYRCIYCTYPIIEGRKVRMLNVDLVVETLVRLYKEKKINYVFFTDSVFNMNNNYNIELAEKIIQSGIKIHWGAYFSPFNLTQDLVHLFKKSGLKHIEFGTESLSDTQLINYGKHFNVEDVIKSSEYCNKAGVYFAHFMILGGWGETEATLAETFENSKRIKHSVFFPFIGMRIYPNTPLHDILLREGIIKSDNILLDPTYYISDKIDLNTLKSKAKASGRNWEFPDDDKSEAMEKIRAKKRKGLLWHLLLEP